MASTNHITFYFDVVSPWSHVAHVVLYRYAPRPDWNTTISYRPMNLGYIMKTSGNRPPMSVQNKRIYLIEERIRAERFFGVTLRMPKVFPMNTVAVQCVLRELMDELGLGDAATDDEKELSPFERQRRTEKIAEYIDSAFRAIWERDAPMATVEDLGTIFPTLSSDFLTRSITNEKKARLKDESIKFAQEGALFGAPWIVARRASDGKEAAFFGSDRFEAIAAFLGVQYHGPLANGITPKL